MPFDDRMHGMGVRFFHYAFLDGRLIGSENPAITGSPQQVIAGMLADGLPTLLLTLTQAFRSYPFPGLSQFHLPIADLPTTDQVQLAIHLIHEHLTAGERVWVHCQQGIDRTGCIIGAYRVSQGEDPEQVLASLLEKLPAARRNPRMVQLWQPYADIVRSFRPN